MPTLKRKKTQASETGNKNEKSSERMRSGVIQAQAENTAHELSEETDVSSNLSPPVKPEGPKGRPLKDKSSTEPSGSEIGGRKHDDNTTPLATRFSKRNIKKPKRDTPSPQLSPTKKLPISKDVVVNKGNTPETKAKRHYGEVWRNEDKATFFEGLYKYGRDYEAIFNMLTQRRKKRGVSVYLGLTNKAQVRSFYYRTWHKISKYIQIREDVNRRVQELYGLINYGELRKKVGPRLNDKIGQKLNQLIHTGVTLIKYRGKNWKIRTPVCTALKRLNNVTEPQKETIVIPTSIGVELSPRSNKAWAQIQGVSQNPRLRMNLKPDRHLQGIIQFLEKKWKSQPLKLKEKLDSTSLPEVTSTEFRLYPHADCSISPLDLQTTEPLPKLELAFDNYKECAITSTSPPNKKGKKTLLETDPAENSQSVPEINTTKNTSVLAMSSIIGSPTTHLHKLNVLIEDENAMFPDDVASPLKNCSTTETAENDMNLRESYLSPKTSGENVDDNCDDVKNLVSDGNNNKDSHLKSSNDHPRLERGTSDPAENDTHNQSVEKLEEREDLADRIRQGWTSQDCGQLTLGEMYLMFGDNGKLRMEYDWPEIKSEDNTQLWLKLTNLLRRLVHLATTEFTDFSKSRKESPVSHNTQVEVLCHKCQGAVVDDGNERSSGHGNKQSGKSSSKSSSSSDSHRVNNKRTKRLSNSDVDMSGNRCNSPMLVGSGTSRGPGRPLRTIAPAQTPLTPSPILQHSAVEIPETVFRMPIPPRAMVRQVMNPTPSGVRPIRMTPDMVMRGLTRNKRIMRKPVVQRRLLPKGLSVTPNSSQTQFQQLMTVAMVPSGKLVGGQGQFIPVVSTPTDALSPINTNELTTIDMNSLTTINASDLLPSTEDMHEVHTALSLTSINDPVVKVLSPAGSVLSPVGAVLSPAGSVISRSGSPFPSVVLPAVVSEGMRISPLPMPDVNTFMASMTQGLATDMGTFVNSSIIPAGDPASMQGSIINPVSTSALQHVNAGQGAVMLYTTTETGVMDNTGIAGQHTGRALSPPSISNLLDMSLPCSDSADKFYDMAMNNAVTGFSGLLDAGISSNKPAADTEVLMTTPPYSTADTEIHHARVHSPNHSLMSLSLDPQWLNGEVADISLGSLLLTESPPKKELTNIQSIPLAPTNLFFESSRDSISKLDVHETTLQSMMNDSSLDLVSKFADIAAHMNAFQESNHCTNS